LNATGRVRISIGRAGTAMLLADEHRACSGLWRSIESRINGGVSVHLVPGRVSHLHYLAKDEASETRYAEDSFGFAVGLLREHGGSVTGGVGSGDPLGSIYRLNYGSPATASGRRRAPR
jgi:hypothetical protein